MDRIAGGMEALALSIQYLGSFIYVYVEIMRFLFPHSFPHPSTHSFISSFKHLCAGHREKAVLWRARLMKLNKRNSVAQLSLSELRRWS